MKKTQNYDNHTTLDPLFHGIATLGGMIWSLLLIVGFIALLIVSGSDLTNAPWFMICIFVWIILIAIALPFAIMKIRLYSLKNQDRIIRFEEWFRYYVLTGKQIDPALTVKQLIALRFTSDEEFVDMCHKAVTNNMTPTEIKKSIINRRADHQRI